MRTLSFHFLGMTARHAILLTTGLVTALPFIWMVSLSLKSPGELFQTSFSLLPQHWHAIENYGAALTKTALPRFMLNGLVVCVAILGLQILICAPAAYALAKLRFRGRDALFVAVLLALLIPHQVLALPLFVMSYELGLLNTYAALILPFSVSPFGIFLLRQFFKTIPDDIIHAARLDGLSEMAIVWRVMLPMSVPAVAAFTIFSLVAHWNDLFWPLIAVQSDSMMPPALGIMTFRNEQAGDDYGPLMAAATIVVTPLILFFLLAQRWFVEGLSAGGVK